MDIEQLWEKAEKKTEIVRGRVKALATFSHTVVPYTFLAESAVNEGQEVVQMFFLMGSNPTSSATNTKLEESEHGKI